jgi:hypothetical protein
MMINGTLRILAGSCQFSRPMVNYNLTQWTGGNIVAIDQGTFTNMPSTTFDINLADTYSFSTSGTQQARFVNNGTDIVSNCTSASLLSSVAC